MLGCEQLPSQDLLGRIIAVLPPKKYSQEELMARSRRDDFWVRNKHDYVYLYMEKRDNDGI